MEIYCPSVDDCHFVAFLFKDASLYCRFTSTGRHGARRLSSSNLSHQLYICLIPKSKLISHTHPVVQSGLALLGTALIATFIEVGFWWVFGCVRCAFIIGNLIYGVIAFGALPLVILADNFCHQHLSIILAYIHLILFPAIC